MAGEAKTEGDEKTGVQILKRAVEAPTRQIAENSAVDAGVVVARMLGGKGNEGFDAERKEYVDLIEAGIIDPTKVVRVALENAVSVASVLLLTEATMTEVPEEKKERASEADMGSPGPIASRSHGDVGEAHGHACCVRFASRGAPRKKCPLEPGRPRILTRRSSARRRGRVQRALLR